MIPFIGFLPDADPLTPGVITLLSNAVPTLTGYKTQPALVQVLSALPSQCYGAKFLLKLDGNYRIVAGLSNKLYEVIATVWTDRSRGGGYSGATKWYFAMMGDTCLAASSVCILQQSSTAAFADVAGAPYARCIDVASGFVMLANVNLGGGAGVEVDRWICSGYQDYTAWTPSVTTQCTTGRLVDTAGPIKAIKALGGNLLAYKDESIYLGTYIDAPAVWQWDLLSDSIGCSTQDGIVNIDGVHYFISNDDVYACDGRTVKSIGSGIRRWLFSSGIQETHTISATSDRSTKTIWWFVPPRSSSSLQRALVFNYETGKFGYTTYTVDCAIDTSEYIGNLSAAVIDSTHYLAYLNGTPTATMTINTGLIGDDTTRSLITRATPHFTTAPSSATVDDYTSETDGVSLTNQASSTMTNKRFDLLASARFHQLRYSFVGPCEIQGHTVKLVQDGEE